MKKIPAYAAFLTLPVLLLAEPAWSISRYNSATMSCAAVKRAIGREGTVILRYPSARNPRLTLYDRYVVDSGFCDQHEFADSASVPTTDDPTCAVRACKRRPDPEDCFPLQRGCLPF